MTQVTIRTAELEVWHQNVDRDNYGNPEDPPDAVVPAGNVESVTTESRADEVIDEAQIDLRHPVDADLRLGDRVRFTATLSDSTGQAYSEGMYTFGGYGGRPIEVDWIGRIEPTRATRNSVATGSLATDASGWVGGVLKDRTITASYTDEDIGAIIRDIIDRKAPEVSAEYVPDLGETTDVFFQSRDCWDAIVGLAARGDVLITVRGHELHIDELDTLNSLFTLEPRDYELPWKTDVDDDVNNVVRVDSGVSRQLEDADETVDGWTQVTDSNRLTQRLRARKSEIHSLELRVRKDSGDDLRVRLQADEGGAPVAINDDDSDIQSERRDSSSLPGEGWQTFFLSDHTLPDRDPWLIVEAGGPDGHEVALADTTTEAPTYRSYYPHPINFEVSSNESINQYGVREVRIERDNLETQTAARDAARSELARRAFPTKTIQFNAASPRAHSLKPGDVVTVDRPEENATGEYIVIERSQSFDADTVSLETEITATWRKGILAPNV